MDNAQKLEHYVAMLASTLTENEKRYWQNLFFATYAGMAQGERVAITQKYTPQTSEVV